MATAIELKEAIDKFVDETAVRAYQIVNGANDETVTIESGVVPTFAKAIADFTATGMGTVVHGAIAGTARPSGYSVVTWIGSVEPTNAINNDIWEDTSV